MFIELHINIIIISDNYKYLLGVTLRVKCLPQTMCSRIQDMYSVSIVYES